MAAYEESPGDVVLIDTALRSLVEQGCLRCHGSSELSALVQPASVDLPCGHSAYLVKEKVLPFRKRVAELLPELVIEQRPLGGLHGGAVLLKGQTYLIPCGEVSFEPGFHAALNAKSSIGRVDVMVRGIIDECGMYDIVPPMEEKRTRALWLEVQPRSFNVRVREGLALTQMMVFAPASHYPPVPGGNSPQRSPTGQHPPARGPVNLSAESIVYRRSGSPISPPPTHRGALVLSLAVPTAAEGGTQELAGYEAVPTNEVLDLCSIGTQDPSLFFRPMPAANPERPGRLTLEKDHFYILATEERVSVPRHLSAEMVPFSHNVGELRAHYAGFFDPGFGYGEDGERKGTIAVLEVRPHETVTVYSGQPICLMEYYRNSSRAERPYGTCGNTYHEQTGPKLSKYFRTP
eukprot:TRINITY_DN19776_c0_g1_i1.p1 TRINITY_DN19776_c0_g1~~TRINITY_DN19776_c0_g1_i1.p1  ORF type:complete len:405 (+),score=123.05 TRINITY_DN19776_c0_g1_i1:73-1287(+)